MVLDETFELNNGVKIPKLGLGTWLMSDDEAKEAVKAAIECGYRHIDTAQSYGNEAGVGAGVRESGVARGDIFVTTKVAAEHKDYDSVAASIDESLSKLGLDYLDMIIIHSPQPWTEVNQSDDRHFEGNKEAWRAMEDAVEAGKVRTIGVSNFLISDIDNIMQGARITPAVNQVLMHVSNTPFDILDYCTNKGIRIEAYSPVAHGEIMKNEKVAAMANKYGVGIAQLCIRYCLQLGAIALPKSAKATHIKANTNLDFEISAEDMTALKVMEKIDNYGEASFFPVYGGKL